MIWEWRNSGDNDPHAAGGGGPDATLLDYQLRGHSVMKKVTKAQDLEERIKPGSRWLVNPACSGTLSYKALVPIALRLTLLRL